MPKIRSIILGKLIFAAAKLRGGGSAFPGLVIEKTDKNFIRDCLSQLPKGVVVISGTNGKTTTTKIVVELIKSQGLTVFTNKSGSNLLRGIIAELIREVTFGGKLRSDIAVLELDEAHATYFINIMQPKFSLLLNVYEDQTDRFGDADRTASLLARIADKTTDCVVTSRDDPRLCCLEADADIAYFGSSPELAKMFHPTNSLESDNRPPAHVLLKSVSDTQSEFTVDGNDYSISLSLNGIYNSLNAAAALTLAKTLLPYADVNELLAALQKVRPADGRGEIFNINGTDIQLLLVKNAAGFNLTLASFCFAGFDNMIATNNALADGLDISWLSDVDFSPLKESGVAIVSGTCAADTAKCLKSQGVAAAKIDTNLTSAVNILINSGNNPKRIFCSYTAMVVIRKQLMKLKEI